MYSVHIAGGHTGQLQLDVARSSRQICAHRLRKPSFAACLLLAFRLAAANQLQEDENATHQ
jgi:hypothetical protein